MPPLLFTVVRRVPGRVSSAVLRRAQNQPFESCPDNSTYRSSLGTCALEHLKLDQPKRHPTHTSRGCGMQQQEDRLFLGFL